MLKLWRAFACPSAPTAARRSGFWAPTQSESSLRRGPRLQSPRRKPSVPLGKGFGSTRPPPASRLRPQLPCFDEQWGNESPALKILWFYLDKKKNLACLHWHTKIALVWVNLQSFSWWKYLASLFFFLTYHINLFIECPSFLLLYQDICRRLLLVLFLSPEIICRAFETSSCCIVVMQCAAVAWTYRILMRMSC